MFHIESPLGIIRIGSTEDAITDLQFCIASDAPQGKVSYAATNIIEERVAEELLCYFDDPQYPFSVATKPSAETPFRRKVWLVLQTIKAGERFTYQQVAKRISSHPRPVGSACRNNSILIIIPCHRVVPVSRKVGEIGNYLGESDGKGRSTKEWLLHHESGEPPLKRGSS